MFKLNLLFWLSIISICLIRLAEGLELREAIKLPWQLFKPGHVSQLDLPRGKIYLAFANQSGTFFERHSLNSTSTSQSIRISSNKMRDLYTDFSVDRTYIKVMGIWDQDLYLHKISVNMENLIKISEITCPVQVDVNIILTPPVWIKDDFVILRVENEEESPGTGVTKKLDSNLNLLWPGNLGTISKGAQKPRSGPMESVRILLLDNETIVANEKIAKKFRLSSYNYRTGVSNGNLWPECDPGEDIVGFDVKGTETILVCSRIGSDLYYNTTKLKKFIGGISVQSNVEDLFFLDPPIFFYYKIPFTAYQRKNFP